MQITATKSITRLFVECIVLQIIVNTLVYIVNFFNAESFAVYFTLGGIQMLLGLCIGIYLRKVNKAILWEQTRARKRYAIISLIYLACVIAVICIPDVIAMPYVYITTILYNLFGLDRLFTMFDFLSIAICLVSVFIPQKPRH